MKHCIKCDLSYDDNYEYCQKCGKKIYSDELINLLLAPLDTSKEGLVKTINYLDNVLAAMKYFEYLVGRVIDLMKSEREQKNDRDWKVNISTEITLMRKIWNEEIEDAPFSLDIIKDTPSGCAILGMQLGKMVAATENFGENYILKWLLNEDLEALKVSHNAFSDICKSMEKVYEELTGIWNELNQLS